MLRPVKHVGLTAIELIVVLIIVLLLAAIAIPRFSSAAIRADDARELREQLSVVRSAIEMYYYDHGVYPAAQPTGCAPARSSEAFHQQLTLYTDRDGIVSNKASERFAFGPYLRRGVPASPVSDVPGLSTVLVLSGPEHPAFQAHQPGAAWVYNCETGEICANSNGYDASGIPFDRY